MSSPDDHSEKLRRANPVPVEDVPSADSPKARALFERIVSTPTDLAQQVPRRSRRRLAWVVVPVAILAAAGTAYGIFHGASEALVTVCFREARLTADRAEVPSSSDDPVQACLPLWAPGGEFNPDGTAAPQRLAACLLETGAVGVFPGAGNEQATCSALGLPLVHDRQGEQEPVRELQNRLADQLLARCLGPGAARSRVQHELGRSGIDGWRVLAPSSFPNEQSCASVAFDPGARTITIVPVNRPSTP